MAASWNALKRDRDCVDWGREDEPLSKRINNLHLDSAGSLACGSPCPNGGQLMLQHPGSAHPPTSAIVGCHQPTHASHLPAPHHYLEPPMGDSYHRTNPGHLQQTNGFVEQQCSTHAEEGPAIAQYSTHLESYMGEMIANRELPESLSIHYPTQNPTSNPHYFVSNRVLYELHHERLKRSGKI